jgi:hypothetical protein
MKNIKFIFTLLFTLALFALTMASSVAQSADYAMGELIFSDSFSAGLKSYVVETPSDKPTTVTAENGKLLLDVAGGATVWLNKKLSGDVLIEFKRKVIMDGGKNDRLSDFNMFWMARDPKNENLFTRNGVFNAYESINMYYVGIGGNGNTTTRLRKYENGVRNLLQEYQDKAHLLEANKEYAVKIVVYKGESEVYLDNQKYFEYQDSQPYTDGYFGFRTTESRQEISDFKIYQLK